ncbi:very short patch repair endonuclease [Gordonia sp. PKS22-38]|uniref:Very short patch repair endonuclease n=1 Tax=Gordonia prachuapensis TaxID=3115651 RepID=A0ABU7MY38_9ACTN|nr:very short patch repair endonuclease [Gordonia sp. PKS22-38]
MSESWASSPAVRASMRGNCRRDTGPELAVRRGLHAAGFRYRVDHSPLPGSRRPRADIVFIRVRIAVFIDGCYWHGCPDHYRPATRNVVFWEEKLRSNRERDARSDKLLRDAGWKVLRFWEHQPAAEVVAAIGAEVVSRSG